MKLDWLSDKFRQALNQTALIWRGQKFSYAWLSDRTAFWRERFVRLTLAAQRVVSLETDYSPDACALLLALIEHDCIIVPLSTGHQFERMRFRKITEVQATFAATATGDWDFVQRPVEVENELTRHLIELRQPGLVLFSSGSTGESKAALHDFGRLLAKFQMPRSSLRTLAFLLFDHIGGINTLFHVLANTGTLVVAETRSADSICALVERHEVELLPTSPTFLNLLFLSEAYQRYNLSSLKRITYGTEPMTDWTLTRLYQAFPKVRLTQTYGLSELGILRSKSKGSDSHFMKVGGEGYETKIVDGILWIRAEAAMLGYLNAPSPFDSEGWFNTGDEVEVCGEYLRVLGRRCEVINVGGEKVFPVEVEGVLESLPNIAEATVRGLPNPITGQTVVAHVTLMSPENHICCRTRIRNACRQRLAAYKIPTKVVVVDEAELSARFKKRRNSFAAYA